MKQITCIVDDERHAFLKKEADKSLRTIGNQLLARAFPDESGATTSQRVAKVIGKNSTKKERA